MSITTLFGSEGIITKAQEAGSVTKSAKFEEELQIYLAELKMQAIVDEVNFDADYVIAKLNDKYPELTITKEGDEIEIKDNGEKIATIDNNLKVVVEGTPTTPVAKTLAEKMTDAGITGDPESLSDVVDGVPIPKDFTVSTVTGEKTKAEGLVIIDDNLNEFVWVPVKDLTADGTIDGTNYNQKFGRRLFGRSYSLGGTTPEASKYTESIDPLVTTSVANYGGFYIARYEASYEVGKVASKPSTIVETTNVTKVNGRLWNYITQIDAIAACENMYASDAKVKGHLPYGAEWDTTLQWFKQTVFSNSDSALGTSSTSWGNCDAASYKYGPSSTQKNPGGAILLNTGIETVPANRHMVNNIYDIAGNLSEWTQEKFGTGTSSANRGGNYSDANIQDYHDPAAFRGSNYATGSSNCGFRPALYIK